MPKSEQTPKVVSSSKVVITALIAGGLAVCVATRTPGTDCDANAKARRAWLRTAPSDGRSPANEGYRLTGECDRELLHREFSCEEASVRRINADNPYMKEAIALGFAAYVCESPSGGRVEYPMQRILAP